jgi:hypothetical protein
MGEIRVPLDIERWPEFRVLAGACGASLASHLFLRLWIEFGHVASVASKVGFLSERGMELFQAEVESVVKPDALASALVGDAERRDLKFLFPVEGGFECPRFAQLNGHLDPKSKPMHQKGYEASRYLRRLRREQAEATGQALLLPTEHFTTAEGARMDAEMIRRIEILVRTVDNALGRVARPPTEFSRGLVLDAYAIAREFTDLQVYEACRKIHDFRGHAAMPETAEKLLPKWNEIVRGLVEGEK